MLLLTACTTGTEESAADLASERDSLEAEAVGEAETVGFTEPEDLYALTDPELTERLHLPLYDYLLDEYEQWTIGRARDVLIVECLVGLGFEAEVNPSTNGIEETLTHFGPFHEYRLYGVASVDLAEEYGFGVPLEEGTGDPLIIADGFDEEAAYAAVDGFSHTGDDIRTPSGDPVPEGGCMHQANLRISPDSPAPGEDGFWIAGENGLMPDTPGLHHLAEDLIGTSYFTAQEDTGVAAAAEAWKDCADLSGYTVDPGGASEILDDGGAVLSARCLDSSGYLDAFVDAQTRAQEPLVEEHRAGLEERREQLDAELAAARAVLGW